MQKKIALLLGALVAFAAATQAQQPIPRRRIALVIGNSAYEGNPTPAAAKDANQIQERLAKLRFAPDDLLFVPDATAGDMNAAITKFRSKLLSADEAVFFYAGHGAQVGGKNFMLPVKTGRIADLATFERVAVPITDVYEAMRVGSSRFNLIILDTCRDNPSDEQQGDRIGLDLPKGLAQPNDPDIPVGTIIAFSTRPGTLAIDAGVTGNSPYADALLTFMSNPGLSIQDLFMRVRNDVQDRTSAAQTSWESTSQTVDFAFQDPAQLVMTLAEADDEVIAFANTEAVLFGAPDGKLPHTIRLKTGENFVRVYVHNDKTSEGGNSWGRPEGWKFKVQLDILPPSGYPTTAPTLHSVLEDREREDPKANGRWGATFLAAAARILVGFDGSTKVTVLEHEIWRDGFSLATVPSDREWDAALSWAIWHEGVRLFDDGVPGQLRPVVAIVAEAAKAHRVRILPAEGAGSSSASHERAADLLDHSALPQLEEALLRVVHAEIDHQTHAPEENLRWVLRNDSDERGRYVALVNAGNFDALRKRYADPERGPQQHNLNARNVLALLSNGDIARIVHSFQ